EAPESFCTDRISESQRIIETVRRRLETDLGVDFDVRLVEPKTLERSEGKAQRVIDRRRL
ncbi:MAG TPA: phenylacetate--CoA ligase, partial [Desulfovibrio sp.]|nr:phenylacetate--CoA ligase [Desulfovibrio sp.]